MKDVGLDDLDGYNNSTETPNTDGATVTTLSNNTSGGVVQQNATTIISSQVQSVKEL